MKKIITIATLSFLGIIFLAGCGEKKVLNENMVQEMNKNQKTIQQQNQSQQQEQQQVNPEEVIDFEHPGSDEAGKKIQEMDSLINSTSTNEYGDDLSEEILVEQE